MVGLPTWSAGMRQIKQLKLLRYFMSVPTKIRRIRRTSVSKPKAKKVDKELSIHWREVFKEELEKYGEAGLMLRGCRYKE